MNPPAAAAGSGDKEVEMQPQLQKGGEALPSKKAAGAPQGTDSSPPESSRLRLLLFCFLGLQVSYLTWGYVQEKIMTKQYTTGTFPSATFCVFSNRVLAIIVAAVAIMLRHGRLSVPAPVLWFAPCAISNTLSSFGQYQALRYVSFPLQTLCKSTKVIPVMLMGKFLNKKEVTSSYNTHSKQPRGLPRRCHAVFLR